MTWMNVAENSGLKITWGCPFQELDFGVMIDFAVVDGETVRR